MEALLTRMRDAVHADRYTGNDGHWLVRGPHEACGFPATLDLCFDREGRFRRCVEGELGMTEAFDGVRGWKTDLSGATGALQLSDLARAQLEIRIMTGVWLANPELIDVVGVTDVPEEPEISLTVRVPGSPVTGELVVDRATALPLRLERRGIEGETCLEFEDHREVAGVCFPGRTVRTASGHVESRTELLTLEPVPANGESGRTFTREASLPGDSHFRTPSGEVPLRFAPTGHLLVEPTINGVAQGAFIFDSGAGQCGVQVDPPASLGLREVGSAIVASILGVSQSPILRGAPLELGPLTLSDPVFMTMDFSPFAEIFGEPLCGVIGYDVLRRSVVELDLAESRMVLHEPAGYELAEGEWMELLFQDNHPIVPARVEGHAGLFRLDLGASGGPHGNLVLHGPAVAELGLLDNRETQATEIGEQQVALGAIESFELAGVEFPRTDVVFGLGDTGLFTDAQTVGNIGLDLLRAFRIVFDYGNERIAFVPKPGGAE